MPGKFTFEIYIKYYYFKANLVLISPYKSILVILYILGNVYHCVQ